MALLQTIFQLCHAGGPHGSVLSSLLFLVYVNDLMDLDVSEGSSLLFYANDILLYQPITLVADFTALQNDVTKICDWTSCNFMSFNEAKPKVMHVSRKRTLVFPTTPITRIDIILETVSTNKYLGLLIPFDLSWTPHIQNVCSKARKILGLLYR